MRSLIAFFILLWSVPAHANFWGEWNKCHKATGTPAITACNWLLKSGKLNRYRIPIIRLYRAEQYNQLEKYEDAIKDYTHALKGPLNRSRRADALHGRAIALAAQKKYKSSVKDYTDALLLKRRAAYIYNNRGNAYLNLRLYKEAIRDYNTSLRLDSRASSSYLKKEKDKSSTFTNRGLAYYRLGEYKQAIKDFTRGIRQVPKSAKNWGLRGDSYLQMGDYKNAIKDYNKAIDLDPTNMGYRRDKGWTFEKLEKNAIALSTYTEAIAIKPDDPKTLRYRGDLYFKEKKYDLAATDYARATKYAKDDSEYLTLYSKAMRKLGKTQEAISFLTKNIEKNPKSAIAYKARGDFYYSYLHDFAAALKDYDVAVALKGDKEVHIKDKGNALRKLKRYSEAIALYSSAIVKNNDTPWPYSERALAYVKSKQYDLAVADLDTVIRLQPQYRWHKFTKGFQLSEMGRFAESITVYSAAIKARPGDYLGYGYRGLAYSKWKKHDKAADDFTTSIEKAPALDSNLKRWLLVYRAISYAHLKKTDQAEADVEKALTLANEDSAFLAHVAWYYYNSGQYDKGVAYANKSLKLGNESVGPYRALAHIYEKTGRNEDAIRAFKTSLKIDPEHKESQEGLQRLGAAN